MRVKSKTSWTTELAIQTIVIAGVTSGVGKTTIATAIMRLLTKKGFSVQPFKVGPDFIDPTYHNFVTGRHSRNLDVWMMEEEGVLECFTDASTDADIAVVEGVMGLFDGFSGKDNFASTAHVASLLGAPVILVVDAAKAARSLAAIVTGFMRFDSSAKIAGLIFNNVASDKHAGYISESLEGIKIPVIGMIRRDKTIKFDERHLGLIPAAELSKEKKTEILESVRIVSEQIDYNKLSEVLGKSKKVIAKKRRKAYRPKIKIAVALDESFNFYYFDNLEALKRQGAELVFFSPVNDRKIPEGIDGMVLGGGFPEVLADRLESNQSMMKSVRKIADKTVPIYAECGGLMYLTNSIIGYGGKKQPRKMVGIIDADTVMGGRLTLNYTEAEYNGPLLGTINRVKGHEFHYSRIENIARDSRFAYRMNKGRGVTGEQDGFIIGENGIASYMHLHFADEKVPARIVDSSVKYSRK